MGMEMAGHKCVGFCEIDKFARQSYKAIYDTEGEWEAHDITKVTDDEWRQFRGAVDVICGGFPCQAFSIAGHRRGFQDTRGTLFFEIARAAQQIKPRLLLLENVKGLLSHEGGRTFAVILSALDELGYDAEWQVLNTKDFSTKEWPTPQNRERVFIVGHLRGQRTRKIFPVEGSDGKALKQIIDGQQGMRVYDPSGVSCTLSSEGGGWGAKTGLYVFQKTHGDAKHNWAIIHDGYRIRRLTPRECWRLQGFPDWAFDKAKQARVSNTQLYKQAGNSVTVNVVYEIAKRL